MSTILPPYAICPLDPTSKEKLRRSPFREIVTLTTACKTLLGLGMGEEGGGGVTGVSDSRPGSEDDAFTSAKTGSELTRGKTEVSINLDKNKNSDQK